MSIKNLFGKTVTSYDDVAVDVESTTFVDEVVAKRDTYLPPIDFSDPKNFVFYGSAELYYEAAIKRIYEDYPYDGSKAEQIDFEERSSYLERWLYDSKYPKTTGHVTLGTSGDLGTKIGTYYTTTTPEYIKVNGGLHTDSTATNLDEHFEHSAKYDTANNRTQNFNCDFVNKGITIEFWMKKDTYTNATSEVVLDLWNSKALPTSSRFMLGFAHYSSLAYFEVSIEYSGTLYSFPLNNTGIATDEWTHYGFSFINESTGLTFRLYLNGAEVETKVLTATVFQFTGLLNAFVGSMQKAVGAAGATNGGKLSAQLDEFRFWKTRRTSRQIKLNWFREIGGGANTDDNTSDLGVYLKFNEGITGNNSIDSIALDYSGRLANGTWEGYSSTTSARSTDSAMTTAGYTEKPSPIIYSNHPSVVALESEMTLSGSDYDSGRGQSFYRSLPNWLIEEDQTLGDENLRKISHIMSSYMDTLKVQIDSLNSLQDKQYLSSSYKSSPFAEELLKGKGFVTSEMFLSSEVFETFSNIDYDANQFDLNVDEIKNLIFTNIYNNLENIYNSKGTEKSIRNLIRCFGIDDELIKLNQYTDNGTQYLGDKYRTTSVKKKYINLNSTDLFSGTMYQSGSRTFISGSNNASVAAFTMEADIVVPNKRTLGENSFFPTPFLSASIMGFHEADPSNSADFTWSSDGAAEARDLQVYLVRDSAESKNAKFVIKNQSETIYASSSYIYDIYEEEHYNVALRIKPQTYPYAGNVTNTTPDYDIELYAVSHNFDELKEEVLIATTVDNATGSAYLQRPKRIYAASHYENFTGSVLQQTDLEFGRVSAWLDYLPNSSIQEHNKDVLNYGNFKSIDGATAFAIGDAQIPTMDLSILNWDFDTVTTSDSSGEFVIEDTTSGSTDTIYGWVDNIIRREHDGKGDNFPITSTAFLENEFLYATKKELPETSFNVNNIFIKGDRQIFFGEDEDVSDNLFVLEKSPAAIVSEEMLKLFSTTQEFSNLFGRHVDRYRIEYKDMTRARQLFYQRVDTGLDFDKFFTYFKWIDQSISEMINQLIPASVNFAGGVTDVIEPHILERDKYQRQIGLLQTVTSTEASVRGVQELNYNWRIGHAPLPTEDQDSNSLWQSERRARATTDAELIRKVIVRQTDQEFVNPIILSGSDGNYSGSTYATRRFSKPVRLKVEFSDSIHGGINYEKSKDRDLFKSGIGLHSPIGTSGAPKNVITFGAGLGDGLNVLEDLKTKDTLGPSDLIKYDGFGMLGKFTDFVGSEYAPLNPQLDYYSRRKVSDMFIGNIVSSSVNTGYNSTINTASSGYRVGVNVVNLHSDTTDITNVIPIQGPFTERWVGGRQSRHTTLNSPGKFRNAPSGVPNDLDSEFSRPEEYRLLIGKNPIHNSSSIGDIDNDQDGALGFTAPDYGLGLDNTWPDTDRLYSIFYREERAKRSLNIKNIQTTTSSVYHGNYQHEYEVFSTFGDQGYFLKRAGNLLPDTISQALPETTNYQTLVAQDISVSGNYFGAGNNRQYEFTTETPLTNAYFEFEFNSAFPPEGVLGPFELRIERANYILNSSVDENRAIILEFDPSNTQGTVSRTSDVIRILIEVIVGDWGATLVNLNAVLASPPFSTHLSFTTPSTYRYKIAENVQLGDDGNGGAIAETPANLLYLDKALAGGISSYEDFGNITETQDRSTGSAHVIRTRFSAPGGPEVNSSGYLDVATQQYSAYNSINFRNLTTRGSGSGESGTIRVNSHANRREGLITLLSRHQGQFGIDSQHGSISSTDYIAEASFQKQHRNTRKVAKLGDFTNPVWTTETSGTIKRYDNALINTPIPASDFQYSWINAAISGSNWEASQKVLTYAPKNGIISSSSGIDSAINFPGSDVECFPCFDLEVLSTSLTYFTYALPITTNTTLTGNSYSLFAMLDNSSTPFTTSAGIVYPTIDDSRLNNITFSSTYSGCCDSGDLTYAIAVDGDTPSYASGAPVVPTIYFNQDCRVSMRYYIKNCLGSVSSISATIINASADQPVATTTAFVELNGVPNVTYNSNFNIYMFASTELSTDALGANSIDRIDLSVLLENFCCPDVTYEYDYRNQASGGPVVIPNFTGANYLDVGSNLIRAIANVLSYTNGITSFSIGSLTYSSGATVRFKVRSTDCNENTSTIMITINNATL